MTSAAHHPIISLDNPILQVVGEFTYLSSSMANNPYLDTELNKYITKAVTAIKPAIGKCVLDNAMLTTNTKTVIYRACVPRTLLYRSETWTMYMYFRQER